MPCALAAFPRESPVARASADGPPVYRPRTPEASPLWQLVAHHAPAFLDVYDERYAPRYGPLRAVIPRALEGFHRCGVLAWGFARVRCPDCRHEYLLAFSCKQRCLCPSCHAKRQAAFGTFVTEEILEPVPHRHMVISLPRRLRPFFRRRKCLTRLARLAYETIKDLLQNAVGSRTAVPGAVACLQSAGNVLDWHPPVHLLFSWGLFRRDGAFLPVEGSLEPETVARLFRHRVLRMLLEEGAIEEGVARNLLAWPHTGFGTHVSRAIPADATTPGVVARYMARPPVTPERMLGDADKNQVIYRSDAIHPRHRSAELATKPGVRSPGLPRRGECPHPRPPREDHPLLRPALSPSKGWYSNRTRGYRKQHGLLEASLSIEAAPAGDARAPLEARRSWARLLRQVYEVEPLSCARCGGTLKLIAVIERPAVIQQILAHLGLLSSAPSFRAPPDPRESPAAAPPREWSYEPLG